MNYGNAPQLLDRGDVAMGCESRKTVRMAATLSPLQRIDSAFRLCRAHWLAAVSLNRVSPEQGASELCAGLPRDLDRDALPTRGCSSARKQGIGNG